MSAEKDPVTSGTWTHELIDDDAKAHVDLFNHITAHPPASDVLDEAIAQSKTIRDVLSKPKTGIN